MQPDRPDKGTIHAKLCRITPRSTPDCDADAFKRQHACVSHAWGACRHAPIRCNPRLRHRKSTSTAHTFHHAPLRAHEWPQSIGRSFYDDAKIKLLCFWDTAMTSPDSIYAAADQRRAQHPLQYAGALTPAEAFELLKLAPAARLADSAAAANAGFTRAYDILEGFEGNKDPQGHRKTIGGWCFRDLPWQPRSPDAPAHAASRRSGKRILWLATVLVLVVAVLLWWHPWQHDATDATSDTGARGAAAALAGKQGGGQRSNHGGGAFASLPQPVKVATVSSGEMPIVISALGTVTPLATVTVRTQLNGPLISVDFQEGQFVKRGDMLAQIDPRPYEISLRNAEGQLAKNQALLRQAISDLNAYQTLLKQDSISRQQADTQASLVEQYRGQVKSDQATIDTYKLDLAYARITAPVSGRVGLRQVDPGNYVTTSDTNGIVVITQMQPISVVFTTSEDNLQAILKQWSAGAKMSATA
ncbi:hypothetical protein DFQ30_002778, partial [Apophysomyces sp. BC1015]